MKERLDDIIREYERKREWYEKQVLVKKDILANVLSRYDKGEVSYAVVERSSKDLAVYDDLLNNTIKVLKDLNFIKEGV